MEPRSSLYQAIDARLDGGLRDQLAGWRGAGDNRRSWDHVALLLHEAVDVRISGETLRQWARQLGIEPDDEPSPTKAAS